VVFGYPRPATLDGLRLPPEPMPSHDRGRPLKAWRYVGVYGAEVMLCLASVRIGPARQAFWAVWDRDERTLRERTVLGRGDVRLGPGYASVVEPEVDIELRWSEGDGIETVCPHGHSYAWTRKQGGVLVEAKLEIAGATRQLEARGVIDDTAGYYARHTRWQWCAGVGRSDDGHALAWNLVAGVNDPPVGSERTVWVDGQPQEAPPCRFAADLSSVDELQFRAEAMRRRRENLLVVRSDYRQPFGTFSGRLPGGIEVAEGYGVMEHHDAWW
jgi:hypothetical protein